MDQRLATLCRGLITRLWRNFLPALLLVGLLSCVTSPPEAQFGIQLGHESYIPARVAILPCQTWPNGARFAALALSNVTADVNSELCLGLDQFSTLGFSNQPYMKGFSPSFVGKALTAAQAEKLLSALPGLWNHLPSDCQNCQTAPAFYAAAVATRQAWLLWLSQLSQAVRNADAVLLPFITYAYERRFDDRGIDTYERGAGAVLLLIDTTTGALLWAGGRDAVTASKRLAGGTASMPIAAPPWPQLTPRLYTEDLWREFPGRQIF